MSQTKVEAPFVENNIPFRNLIMNGDMQIHQRGGTTQITTSDAMDNPSPTLDFEPPLLLSIL